MSDIETVLRRTTPESLGELDMEELRRAGRHRRTLKRTASVLSVALVLGGVGMGVALQRPAPVRFAAPAAPAWQELDLQEAVARLRETAREHAAVPPAPEGKRREVRVVGTVARGVSDDDGTREWMVPFEVRVRDEHDSFRGVYEREEDRLQFGMTLDDVRRTLAELPPPGGPTMTVDKHAEPAKPTSDEPPVPSPIDEAEELAAKPEPFTPSPEETKRPDRAYAFVRLSDALRQIPLEPSVLDRGYGVLATLGESWVSYRGLTTDLLGRQVVAFSAVDPANDSEQWLLFDPDTGRVWGEFTYQLLPEGPQFRGGAAVEYLEVDAR